MHWCQSHPSFLQRNKSRRGPRGRKSKGPFVRWTSDSCRGHREARLGMALKMGGIDQINVMGDEDARCVPPSLDWMPRDWKALSLGSCEFVVSRPAAYSAQTVRALFVVCCPLSVSVLRFRIIQPPRGKRHLGCRPCAPVLSDS